MNVLPARGARLSYSILIAAAAWTLVVPSRAHAWYDHVVVMEWVQKRLQREVANVDWKKPLPPSQGDERDRFSAFASTLLLSSTAELVSLGATTPSELLRKAAEDPDHGMDRDLPETADPSDDRRYMGGAKGFGSSGFRHMYWGGWDWKRPIATFQIPSRALGQSIDRLDLIANEARERLRKGDTEWGFRLLGWALHYVQDMTQPFHAVMAPSLRMIPWSAGLAWPPSRAMNRLVAESTRTITNYHWTYEGYVRHALQLGEASPFKGCFEKSGGSILVPGPRELGQEIATRSIARARATGTALVGLVGTYLKDPSISVPLNPAQIDNADLLRNPAHAKARDDLNRVTCESFQLATDASIWLVNWALKAK
jgi:hypothetical protein